MTDTKSDGTAELKAAVARLTALGATTATIDARLAAATVINRCCDAYNTGRLNHPRALSQAVRQAWTFTERSRRHPELDRLDSWRDAAEYRTPPEWMDQRQAAKWAAAQEALL